MSKITNFIVKKRTLFCAIFALLFVLSAIAIPFVNVNYDDTWYLPDSSNTKKGLSVMDTEFGGGGTATALLKSNSITEILDIKSQISAVEGVSDVIWIDNIILNMTTDDESSLSDAQTIEYFFRILEIIPTDETANAYDLTIALNTEFNDEELPYAIALMQNMIDKSYGDEAFDILQIMELTEKLPDEYFKSIESMQTQIGASVSQMGEFLPKFIDGIITVNMEGTELSAEQGFEYLMRAISVVPSDPGTTFGDISSALNANFTNEELPILFKLLSAITGMDFTTIDINNPFIQAATVPSEYLESIATVKLQFAQLAPMLTNSKSELFSLFALTDEAVAQNKAGNAITGENVVSLLMRLIGVLPTESNAITYDLINSLSEEFTNEELPFVINMMGILSGDSFDTSGMTAEQIKSTTEPLGADFINIIKGFSNEKEGFLKNDMALFTIIFQNGDYDISTNNAIKEITALSASESLYISGNAARTFYERQNQTSEIIKATIFVVLIALFVLFALSSSWFDPIIYIITIIVAIVLNLGSNLIFVNVSYLTQSVAIILQLALSIDYSVFLMNRYKKERSKGKDAKMAMSAALVRSFSPISASSLTTIACFVTIMFMQYKLGFDMGIVMAKGILLSLVTVFLLMPSLIILFDEQILKREHKTMQFRCVGLSKFSYKYRFLIAALVVVIIIPSAFFASKNTFSFGSNATQVADGEVIKNRQMIENTFGSQEQLAVLVPKNNVKELTLSKNLSLLAGVIGVTSWSQISESGFDSMLPDSTKSQLVGTNDYNRILLTLDCEEEGEETKILLSKIENQVVKVYGEDAEYYLLGNTAAAIDIEANTSKDFTRTSIFSIIAVGAIISLSFGSMLIPVILVAVIQGSIWINMSIPFLLGDKMIFLGYMIISNILLGATIDYAILLTSNYMVARKGYGVADSVRKAQSNSMRSILTSGVIFTVGGFILGLTSTFPTVQMLGYSIMRGGICAMLLTIFVLPAFLAILDKPIKFLTKKDK